MFSSTPSGTKDVLPIPDIRDGDTRTSFAFAFWVHISTRARAGGVLIEHGTATNSVTIALDLDTDSNLRLI